MDEGSFATTPSEGPPAMDLRFQQREAEPRGVKLRRDSVFSRDHRALEAAGERWPFVRSEGKLMMYCNNAKSREKHRKPAEMHWNYQKVIGPILNIPWPSLWQLSRAVSNADLS